MKTSPTRILCVDNNQDSSNLVSLLLYDSINSYSVTTVSTAEEALSIIKNQTFNLYILDSRLPKMSGIELCKKIRERDKQTPVIFLTTMARPIDYAEGINAGANEYLVKPNDLGKLRESVRRLLNANLIVKSEVPVKTRAYYGIY